jgi:N-acetylneuraminic acid mutarotase
MKTKSKISAHIIRSAAWAMLFSVALVALSSALSSLDRLPRTSAPPRALTFLERVAYQRAIEDVYWRHRIWPKENSNPKPSLDAVMSQAQLENKVASYLHDSLVLEDYWQRPITAEQLQVEMDRMARETKQPEVLRELFEALGNDPAVIAECLARPILAERLIADFSAKGQTRDIELPQTEALRAVSVVTTLGQVVYMLPKIADAGDPPCTDQWAGTTTANAPDARFSHTAVWTGSEMIVWGGSPFPGYLNTGGRYNPSTDSWTAISTTNAPSGRANHTAVWTGSEMIIWGGFDQPLNTGGRYNPTTDSWTATSTTNAPTSRYSHTAIWTGSEMIVWGGDTNGSVLNTGGRYNPSTNSWTATSTTNAPSVRSAHKAVWTGSEMIVWGGYDGTNVLNTGGRYNPSTNSWTATSTTNAPSHRVAHTAVWTGSEMIVWGGTIDLNNGNGLDTGGRYNPSTNSWTATSMTNAPAARFFHTAVWTGSEMIVWGGDGGGGSLLNTGGRYNPGTNSWTATSTANAPAARDWHTTVWTGSEMIVWGGIDAFSGPTNTGGRYCAQSGPAPTPTPTPTPTAWPIITPRPLPTYPPRPTRPPR